MILLIDKNPAVRKKLCDMLNLERIIAVATKQQVLESLVHHRDRLNVLIANAASLSEILSGETLLKLCAKLAIDIPPIVALYQTEQKAIINNISNGNYRFEFVEFDEKNTSFPEVYIKAIKTVYPSINVDINTAKAVWSRTDAKQDLIDIRNWLSEFGLDEASSEKPSHPQGAQGRKKETDSQNYKALYLELKEKYDKLVAEFEELKKLLDPE